MFDYTAKSMSEIMEAYKNTLRAKKVETPEPKTSTKKTKVAKPVHKTRPVNLCKEEPKTVVKKGSIKSLTKPVCEGDGFLSHDDFEEKDTDVTDISTDVEYTPDEMLWKKDEEGEYTSRFAGGTLAEKRANYIEVSKMQRDKARAKHEKVLRERLAGEGFSDEKIEAFLKKQSSTYPTDEEIEAEATLLYGDGTKPEFPEGAPYDGDEDGEDGEDETKKAEDVKVDEPKKVSDDDEVMLNGKKETRDSALRYIDNKIIQLTFMDEDDAKRRGIDTEARVAELGDAAKKLREGATEVTVTEAEDEGDNNEGEKGGETTITKLFVVSSVKDGVIGAFSSKAEAERYAKKHAGKKDDEENVSEADGNKENTPSGTGSEWFTSVKDFTKKTWDSAKDVAKEVKTNVEDVIKKNPKTAAATAATIGALGGATLTKALAGDKKKKKNEED